jgi:hypothetical protein
MTFNTSAVAVCCRSDSRRSSVRALVESAAKLADADKATITRQKDGVFFRAEAYGFSDEFMNYVRNIPVLPERGSATGRALLEGVAVHLPDVQADPDYTFSEAQKLGDFQCILAVPMMRKACRSVSSFSRAPNRGHSPKSKSNSSPPLPIRRLLRSRMCDCSKAWRLARENWQSH